MIKKLVVLTAAALSLAACTSVDGERGYGRGMGTEPSSAPEAAQTTAQNQPDPLLKKVGEIARWEDGATAAVANLKKFTPSGSAAGHQSGNLAFEASISIGTTSATPLDVTLATVEARAGAQGEQCAEVFDSAKGISGMFSGTVSGGRTSTVRKAWSCPAGAGLGQIALQVKPSWSHNPATFEGAVA